MPIISHKQIVDTKQIGVWHIEESYDELFDHVNSHGYNMERLSAISNDQVKKQWLAVRRLLTKMTTTVQDIVYDELGRPYLDGHTSISITHSHERVGIQLSDSKYVGIDLQLWNPSISKIKEKFMSTKELADLNMHNSTEAMHVIWCAKETMFKSLRSEGVLFAEELYVQPFDFNDQFSFRGISTHGGMKQSFDLTFEKVDDYFLVYLVNP